MKLRQSGSERGVAMIEAMIAIVVVSFGLLAVAGLQLAGMRVSQMAYYRSVATTQAYDMADRMRANIAGVNSGAYNAITSTAPARPACSNPFAATGCAAAVMATYDAYAWLTEIGRVLPGGSGSVTRIFSGANATNAFDISVIWTEKCTPGETSPSSSLTPASPTTCPNTGVWNRTFRTQFAP